MIFVAKFFETIGLVFLGAAIAGVDWAWWVCAACLVGAVALSYLAVRRMRSYRAQAIREFNKSVELSMAAHEHEDEGDDEDEGDE